MRRKEERSKQGQTNNKAKQHSTPKAVTFPKLPRVGLEPTTFYTLDRALYHMYIHHTCIYYSLLCGAALFTGGGGGCGAEAAGRQVHYVEEEEGEEAGEESQGQREEDEGMGELDMEGWFDTMQ